MNHSFFQKVMLTIFCGMCAAGLVWFYRHVIDEATQGLDRDPNYNPNTTITRPRPR